MESPVVCLMGPTATGKTGLAIELAGRFPCDIVSVDSAMVYRHMDIGTAKPDADTLRRAPHRLVDIRDPEEPYSAGDFVRDARQAIREIAAAGRVPLLVGGTMMYFRALTKGIAELPSGDPDVRERLDAEAAEKGWPAMHARLRAVDARSAARIKPTDSQRIQRALEVYELSGRPLSLWQQEGRKKAGNGGSFLKIALDIPARQVLHERIEQRLAAMFEAGFIDEVKRLRERPGLTADLPSMRAVGYRQVWSYLAGEMTPEECRYRALVATRQLAKRQITWLRSDSGLFTANPLEDGSVDAISGYLAANHPILG